MPRPDRLRRYTKVLSGAVPEEIYELVRKKAKEKDISVGCLVRNLILQAIKDLGWLDELEVPDRPATVRHQEKEATPTLIRRHDHY